MTATETIILQPSRTSHRRPVSKARTVPRVLTDIPIAAILILQAFMSIRLLHASIANGDESLYIYSGHQLIHEFWHGGGSPYYETYFSGAPVIYPVLAAMADHIGGLMLVRLMSLAFMLTATGLLYATTRRLFGYWPAAVAIGLFASLGITQSLGVLATYDTMALMLMAAAAYCAVRAATSTSARWLLLVPALMLAANATKYASLLFDPVIIIMAALLLRPASWRRVTQRAAVLASTTVVMLSVVALLAGTSYIKGMLATTLARKSGNAGVQFGWSVATPIQVLLNSWDWVGPVVCLGALALLVAGSFQRERKHLALLGLCVTAGLLVVLEYVHLRSLVSANKHEDFGAWFMCIAAGYALARGAELARPWYGKLPFIAAAVAATAAVAVTYVAKPPGAGGGSNVIIPQAQAMRPYLTSPGSREFLLAGQQGALEIPYYLHVSIPWNHVTNDNYIKYQVPGHPDTFLTGSAGFKAAIRGHYFALISFPAGALVNGNDRSYVAVVRSTPGYILVSTVGGPTYIYAPDYPR